MEDGTLHCHVKNITRRGKDGRVRSVVAKAAYNSGQNLWFEREARQTTLAARHDIFHTEIMAPADVAPWVVNREQLWNAVEASVKRKDGRLAKEIVVAITRGIPPDQWQALAADYVAPYLAAGHIADIAIHEDGSLHNPHLHVLLTVHDLKPKGFGAKLADVDTKRFVKNARTGWEVLTNKYLKANGLSLRVNARSFKAQGLDRIPTKHRGPDPAERQARYRAQVNHQLSRPVQERPMSKDHEDGKPVVRHSEETPWYDRAVESAHTAETFIEQANTRRVVYDPTTARSVGLELEDLTPQEAKLRELVADAPDGVRSQMDAEITHQQVTEREAHNQARRLDYLRQRLAPEQRAELDDYLLQRQQAMPHEYLQPEPGPHGDLYHPAELERARQRMLEEHEREDEPQR